MFITNPEFRKNFRLEVNTTRLVICFALLLLTIFAFYDSNVEQTPEAIHRYAEKFFGIFCGIGYFFVIIWGTYLSAGSINDEIQQRTWDFVRMSSLSPLKVLTGKLFGSTSLIWIVSLIGVLPVLLVSGATMIPDPAPVRAEVVTLLVLTGIIISWSLLSHAFGIIMSLHALSISGQRNKVNTIGAALLVAFAGIYIGGMTVNNFEFFHEAWKLNNPGNRPFISWYSFRFEAFDFTLILLSFAAFWALVAAYRMMREALLFKDLPWAWLAYLIVASLFLNGLPYKNWHLGFFVWPVFLCASTMALMAMNEARDIVRYQTMAARLCEGKYIEAFRFMPLWMLSFLGLIISIIANLVIADHRTASILCAASIIVLAIRDLLVLHWVSWKPTIRRPLLAFFVYFGLAYGLLPTIFLEASRFQLFFFPLIPFEGTMFSLPTNWLCFYWAFQVFAVSLAGWLFSQRWKVAFKEDNSAKLPAPAGPPQTAA